MGRPKSTDAGRVGQSKDYRTGKVTPWYHLRVRTPEGTWKRVPCRPATQDYEEAVRQLRAWQALDPVAQHRKVKTGELTVNYLLDLFEAECRSYGRAYQPERVQAWRDTLGPEKAVELERRHVQKVLDHWRKHGVTFEGRDPKRVKPISDTTCNRYVAVLRRAFSLGKRDRQLLTPIVFPWFEESPRGTYVDNALSLQITAELRKEKVAGEMRAQQYRLAYLLGLRRDRSLDLGQKNVRFQDVEDPIWVLTWTAKRTKHKQRTHETGVAGEALDILKWAWRHRRPGIDRLFHNNGKRLPDPRYALQRACLALGIPYGRDVEGGMVFHDCRHAAVTQFIATAGDDAQALAMSITDHTDRGVFNRYNVPQAKAQAALLLRKDAYLKRG